MFSTRRSVLFASLALAVVATTLTGATGSLRTARAAGPGHTSVLPGTRVVLRDGAPFIAKGYTYWPQMIGDELVSYISWADPVTCEQDARLLGGAGATLIRIPYEYWLDWSPLVQANYQTCMDSFANHGVGIAWLTNLTVNQPGVGFEAGLAPDNPVDQTAWVEYHWAYISQAVARLKNHPATNMWVIGNEADGVGQTSPARLANLLGDTASAPAKVGLMEPLLARVRAADPNHIVGITISEWAFNWRRRSNLPSLQFWGLNTYHPSPAKMAGLIDPASPTYDPRPNVVTEFGTDRYICRNGLTYLENGASHGSFDCKTATSGENVESQQAQADWDVATWDTIAAGFASPGVAEQQPYFGGLAFTYVDQWNYSIAALNVELSSWVHDVIGSNNMHNYPDDMQTFEWWGKTHAQHRGMNNQPRRVTSLAFDALAERWTGTAAPTISNATVTYDAGCHATISWDSAIPSTGEVQYGVFQRVVDAAGYTESDSTLFQPGAGTPLGTHHSVTNPWNVAPGVAYAWVVRSTAAGERTATAPPIIATCNV